MAALIDSLTPDQQSRMAEFRDRWITIGLATGPADRPRAEAGIRRAYERCGLSPPRIVWCTSPLANGLTRVILQTLLDTSVGASVRDSVRANVWASVWASVGDSVEASVRARVWASVGASVWDNVWDSVEASVEANVGASVRASVEANVRASVEANVRASVGANVRASVEASVRARVWASVGASVQDSVWDSVWDSVRDSVRDSVWASVGASVGASVQDSVENSVWAGVWDSVWASGYGQHDAAWLAFYEYFREVCGLETETAQLDGLWEIARSAGWWLPHEHICWVSERPVWLVRDDQGRLHCEHQAAIEYPDGWGVFAWHGVRVPADVILRPETITTSRIQTEWNVEIRRVLLERYGQERYLRDAGAQQVHRDDYGTLWRIDFADDEPLLMVQVVNSTPEPDGTFKDYWLRVPPTVRTAHQAVAWTYGMTTEEYRPTVQT